MVVGRVVFVCGARAVAPLRSRSTATTQRRRPPPLALLCHHRATTTRGARARVVVETLRSYAIDPAVLAAPARVTALAGDLERSQLGLSDEARPRFRRRCRCRRRRRRRRRRQLRRRIARECGRRVVRILRECCSFRRPCHTRWCQTALPSKGGAKLASFDRSAEATQCSATALFCVGTACDHRTTSCSVETYFGLAARLRVVFHGGARVSSALPYQVRRRTNRHGRALERGGRTEARPSRRGSTATAKAEMQPSFLSTPLRPSAPPFFDPSLCFSPRVPSRKGAPRGERRRHAARPRARAARPRRRRPRHRRQRRRRRRLSGGRRGARQHARLPAGRPRRGRVAARRRGGPARAQRLRAVQVGRRAAHERRRATRRGVVAVVGVGGVRRRRRLREVI